MALVIAVGVMGNVQAEETWCNDAKSSCIVYTGPQGDSDRRWAVDRHVDPETDKVTVHVTRTGGEPVSTDPATAFNREVGMFIIYDKTGVTYVSTDFMCGDSNDAYPGKNGWVRLDGKQSVSLPGHSIRGQAAKNLAAQMKTAKRIRVYCVAWPSGAGQTADFNEPTGFAKALELADEMLKTGS